MLAHRHRGEALRVPSHSPDDSRARLLVALRAAGPLLRTASDAVDSTQPEVGLTALHELRDLLGLLLDSA
jgi:hypothetical protein